MGLLEAAAAAVVCVASDIPENREILEPSGDRLGFFFRSGDAADLKRALTELLELSQVERDRIANAARDRVLAEFNWDRTAEMTDRVYRRLSRRDGYM
ncbi:MAG TPA: glycosyltransferase [Proteobacteria bacterium]|nr:glycosyltransferase [Pseudomonadota bacterium]